MSQVPSKFSELDFTLSSLGGIGSTVQYSNYKLSVVRNSMSYGNKQGLYEIGVFEVGGGMVELPGITDEGDTVKGFLTEDDVTNIMKKMKMM